MSSTRLTRRHGSITQYLRSGRGNVLLVRLHQTGAKKVFNQNPRCFLLQPSSLRLRLTECRDSIVASLRKFDFGVQSCHCSLLWWSYCTRSWVRYWSIVPSTASQPVDPRSRNYKPRKTTKHRRLNWWISWLKQQIFRQTNAMSLFSGPMTTFHGLLFDYFRISHTNGGYLNPKGGFPT